MEKGVDTFMDTTDPFLVIDNPTQQELLIAFVVFG
jgi:hypothetical protein